MADELLNNKIKIKGITEKDGRYEIASDKGEFSFFTTKQDGSDTKAFETFKSLNIKIGDIIGISYSEKSQKNRFSKIITYKTIKLFIDPDDIIMQERNLTYSKNTIAEVDGDTWERKDRTSIAQTAINATALIHEGKSISSEDLRKYADDLYNYIIAKRENKNIEISENEDIPF